MKKLDFFVGDKTELVVALGFFDSIHIGHSVIIEKARNVANELDVDYAVFTFENDMDEVIGLSSGLILTYEERLKKLLKLSVSNVIFTNFTKEFASFSAEKFFNLLITNFNVKAIVCGNDYRFGYMGKGDVLFLKRLCDKNGISLHVVDDVIINSQRVSTTNIKNLLKNGDLITANKLLGDKYFISGNVCYGRAVGRQMGFPTANVIIPSDKAKIKIGVYKTHVVIDGKKYDCITNYGARPTFNLDEVLTETYVDGFNGDLYGKQITIYFDYFIRDCVKFDSVDDLILQLRKDLEKIR